MKIINPRCICRDCMLQLTCRNHKLAIKIQNMAQYIGEDFLTLMIRADKCEKFEGYVDD